MDSNYDWSTFATVATGKEKNNVKVSCGAAAAAAGIIK